jgi:hypothetical protein
MSAFSSKPAAILSRFSPEQIGHLMHIVGRSKIRERAFVAKQFRERARYFDETCQFLVDLGWMKETRGDLELTESGAAIQSMRLRPLQLCHEIVETVAERNPGPYRPLLASYLAHFKSMGQKVVFRPSVGARLKHSAIRDLLMVAGIVRYKEGDGLYELDERFWHLYLWAKNTSGATSKAELRRRTDRKGQIGDSAESAVLDYERRHVGSGFANQVIHVSAENPGACFDIKSLRVVAGTVVRRFIEVKAVPAETNQFYWTAGELEAAKMLSSAYFLYLVPAVGGKEVDLSGMVIIEDPYHNVYNKPSMWEKHENVIVCRRKPTSLTL